MRRMALIFGVAAMLLTQAPASAGGWWTTVDFHGRYIGVGESLSIELDEVLFDSIQRADREANSRYFAYLVTAFDHASLERAMTQAHPKDWWVPLGTPIQIGTVTLFDRDSNLFRGRARVTVPAIPPGPYSLMFCDAGCERPLANLIPVPVNVTSDVLAARTSRKLERTNARLSLALARVRSDLGETERTLAEVQAADATATPPPRVTPVVDLEPTSTPWIAYAGWFVAGAAVAYVLALRWPRSVKQDIIIEAAPDDARELTKTP